MVENMKLYMWLVLYFVSTAVLSDETDCSNPVTTIEVNLCSGKRVTDAEADLEQYLARALERYSTEIEIMETLRNSQSAWLVYRKSYCDAIYELWSGGTVRGAMYNGCLLALTKQRTHNIWSHYLTYMDSTPPVLPEPK